MMRERTEAGDLLSSKSVHRSCSVVLAGGADADDVTGIMFAAWNAQAISAQPRSRWRESALNEVRARSTFFGQKREKTEGVRRFAFLKRVRRFA